MLTNEQRLALPFFAYCSSISEACRKAGISTSTYYMWLNNRYFSMALDKLYRKRVNDTMKDLQAAGQKAVGVLVEILKRSEKNSEKLKAAEIILTSLASFGKSKIIEDRIEQIEELAKKAGLDLGPETIEIDDQSSSSSQPSSG